MVIVVDDAVAAGAQLVTGAHVSRVVVEGGGGDFDIAKRRCEWLADQLNKAHEKGRQCR